MTFTDLILIMLLSLAGWQFVGLASPSFTVVDFLDRFVNSVFVFFGAVILACVAHLMIG